MTPIPEKVISEWNDKQDAIVLTTVSESGIPNSIYATQTSLFENNKVLVANNKFNKTLENIKSNSKASILFITKENKAYQIKGSIQHKTEGEAFDNMKTWNRADLPGHGVAILEVEEIFSGAERII